MGVRLATMADWGRSRFQEKLNTKGRMMNEEAILMGCDGNAPSKSDG